MQRNPSRRQRGFTLVEALVVVVIIGLLLAVGVPALMQAMLRAKLRGTAREAAALMQLAKIEAVRRNTNGEVLYDAVNNRLVAFVDIDGDGTLSAGDRELGNLVLPNNVALQGPGDFAPNGPNAIQGFDDDPPCATPRPGATFRADGSTPCIGALRFTLVNKTAADDSDNSFLEVRVSPMATARIQIQKFFPGQPVAACSSDDPKVGGCWWEFGEGGNSWTWP